MSLFSLFIQSFIVGFGFVLGWITIYLFGVGMTLVGIFFL